jgi:predicted RNA-binding Zn-ribbon protein involved in translation (DUF1610 family)
MGSAIKAECSCGIAATILVGGGMMTFQSICYFPGLCQDCKKVVQVDLLAKELRCPNCEGKEVIAYNDARLVQTPGPRVVVQWGGRTLTDGNYKCPGCGIFSLQFSDGGLHWD